MANRKVAEEWRKSQFSVSFPLWLQDAVREYCHSTGKTQSVVVELALTRFIKAKPPNTERLINNPKPAK